MTRVVVVDYGAGNMVSIADAFERIGTAVEVATDADGVSGADALVVPGVGASAPAMRRLRQRGLDRAIRESIEGGAWYLGVCLGMQLLFERSDEDGARMLGLLEGRVGRLAGAPRLPHIGWNDVVPVGDGGALLDLARPEPFYFVHSYAPVPADRRIVAGETEHGGRFASVIATGRLLGVQFHPERSGAAGLRLLERFLARTGVRTDGHAEAAHASGRGAAVAAGAA